MKHSSNNQQLTIIHRSIGALNRCHTRIYKENSNASIFISKMQLVGIFFLQLSCGILQQQEKTLQTSPNILLSLITNIISSLVGCFIKWNHNVICKWISNELVVKTEWSISNRKMRTVKCFPCLVSFCMYYYRTMFKYSARQKFSGIKKDILHIVRHTSFIFCICTRFSAYVNISHKMQNWMRKCLAAN